MLNEVRNVPSFRPKSHRPESSQSVFVCTTDQSRAAGSLVEERNLLIVFLFWHYQAWLFLPQHSPPPHPPPQRMDLISPEPNTRRCSGKFGLLNLSILCPPAPAPPLFIFYCLRTRNSLWTVPNQISHTHKPARLRGQVITYHTTEVRNQLSQWGMVPDLSILRLPPLS